MSIASALKEVSLTAYSASLTRNLVELILDSI